MKKQNDAISVPHEDGVDPAEPTTHQPGSVEELQQELEQAKTEAAQNYENYLRASADLDNYRRRVTREKEELARYTRDQIVAALLPVLDNLERALASAKEHAVTDDALLQGVENTHKQFRRILEEHGLEEVAAHAGHPFNPAFHEAVGHRESDEHAEGLIVDQLQRGYKLTDRLLRPARVMVSRGKPADSPPRAADQDDGPSE